MNIKVIRIVIIALAAVVLAAVIGIKLLTSSGGSAYGLSVQYCSGNVNVSSEGKIAPASTETKLKEGDSIIVGDGAQAVLAYRVKGSDNDVQISLDSGTDFLVGKGFDGKNKKDPANASVGNGELVVNSLDNEKTIAVSTSNTTFSVTDAVAVIKADAAANVNEGYTLKNVVRVQRMSYAGTPEGASVPLAEKMYTQIVNTANGPDYAAHIEMKLSQLSANTLNTLLVTAFDAQDDLAFPSNDLMNAYNAALAGSSEPSVSVPEVTTPSETTTTTIPEVTTPTPPPTTQPPATTAPPATTTKAPTTAAPVTTRATTTAAPVTTTAATTTVTTANNSVYTVTFIADGKSVSQSVKHGDNAVPPTPAEKKGHTFKSWDKPTTNIKANTTITAIYEEKILTVRLVAGNGYIDQQVKYGKNVDLSVVPKYEVEGKVISGWDKPTTNITENCTITAILVDKNAKKYNVTFVIGNARYSTTVYEGGTAVCPVTVPESTGHTFMYWDKPLTNIKGETTITAIYSDTRYYTVTFISEGTVVGTQTVLAGGSATPPTITNPPANKKFKGWSSNLNNINSNIAVYAEYESTQTYTVTFVLTSADGSSTVIGAPQQIAAGGSAVPPAITIPTGQIFSGWSGNYTNVQGNVVITGSLKQNAPANTYTVTYYNADGSVYTTQQYTHGQSFSYPSPPTPPTGMIFSGWSGTVNPQVTSNMTFTATYTAVPGA